MAKRRRGKRTLSGRLSRAYKGPARDDGTRELQAKRTALVGETPPPGSPPDAKPPDPALSATMPGILFARGVLTREQLEAAERFRRLRCALYGPPWPGNGIPLGDGNDEQRLSWMQCDFNLMIAALNHAERAVLQSVCVFDQALQATDHPALISGLNAVDRQSERRCRRCRELERCSMRRRVA